MLLTDGEDNVSSASLDAAAARAAEVPVHVIELVTERSDRPALDQLAAAGGGAVSSASDPSALTELYRQAAGAVANQYRITYPSSGSGPVELTVRVTYRRGRTRRHDHGRAPGRGAGPHGCAHHDHACDHNARDDHTTDDHPATTTPATTHAPALAAGADPGEPEGSNLGLLVGAGRSSSRSCSSPRCSSSATVDVDRCAPASAWTTPRRRRLA